MMRSMIEVAQADSLGSNFVGNFFNNSNVGQDSRGEECPAWSRLADSRRRFAHPGSCAADAGHQLLPRR